MARLYLPFTALLSSKFPRTLTSIMSTNKNWNNISIQIPQEPPVSATAPFKDLKATTDKINFQAQLAIFAKAAQLGEFTYSFGTTLNEKSGATDVVCVNCEKSAVPASLPSGWALVTGKHWTFTAPTKEAVNVHLFPLDRMTPLGKVGECVLLSVDGVESGMTQGIVVTQGVPGVPGGQLWGLIPGHGLIGKNTKVSAASRKVSCCAAGPCATCVAGRCYPDCLFGHPAVAATPGGAPAQAMLSPTPKKLLASGDKQILINPGKPIDNDFVDLAAYHLQPADVTPLYISEGLQILASQATPKGITPLHKLRYDAAITLLRSVVDVDVPINLAGLRKLSKDNGGKPLTVFKKGMITGWTVGVISVFEEVRITVAPFEDEVVASSGDCGSPWFVVEPGNEGNGGRARARLFGYAYAAFLKDNDLSGRNKDVEVAVYEAAIARLKVLAPGPYMLEPAKTYRWAA